MVALELTAWPASSVTINIGVYVPEREYAWVNVADV